MHSQIIPVILAGGSGTRLWPLSKKSSPKQFLKLIGSRSLFQEALLRVKEIPSANEILVVINEAHASICQKQLEEIGIENVKMILEPCSRNTAPAIALAAHTVHQRFGEQATMVVLPADHLIGGGSEFAKMMASASALKKEEHLITFGVVPTSPKTGYGYIQAGKPLDDLCYRVEKFIEKPNETLAKTFLHAKNYYWNSGIFLFRAKTYLEELKKNAPLIFSASREAFQHGHIKGNLFHIDENHFAKCPSDSIDYAVMEKTNNVAVIPFHLPWNDLGCWASVADAGESDDQNNVIRGNVILKDSKGCLLTSESGQLVATIGIKDLIVVATPDAVLVADKAHAQEVKEIVKSLRACD
ncbi:MAG: mannose-1-phosphate guanylyltransferase/mannose-6-phosphate isomerase [Chlamydiales bacterium]|nr:mannose-1-phosphate guanylyltransferase/mannose-6-phosphate isomerase [Chlamydiales bacterium]